MRRPLALALLFAVSCSDPGGCAGCGGPSVPYPNPAPPGGAVQSGVLRAHITQHALDFLAAHVPALLGGFFTVEGDRAVYYLDEAMFDPTSPLFIRDGCIGEPDSPCPPRSAPAQEAGPTYVSALSFALDELASAVQLTWLDADATGDIGLRFAITDLSLAIDLVMVTNLEALGAAACHLADPTGVGGVRLNELSFDLRLGLDVSSGVPLFTSRVENVLLDLPNDDSAVSLRVTPCDGSDPACDDPRCHGAWAPYPATNCVEVCELFDLFAQLGGFFATLLEPALAELAPTLAAAVSDGLMGALGGVPLALETELPLADLTGGLLPNAQSLYLKAAAGALEVSGINDGRGLDIGLDAGSATSTPAVCAMGHPPPDFSSLLGPPPAATGFVEVFDPAAAPRFDPYHLSVSIAEAVLAQAMWAAFQSGAMCFSLDTYDVEALAGGAFSLTSDLLMSFDVRLAGLTHAGAPMQIGLWATRPPAVRLGAGRQVEEGIYDPLIEITLDDMELSIAMLFDDSMMRVAGVLADLVVQVGVERSPEGVLELVVESLELVGAQQVYNEIAPAADISGLFALMIDLAVTQLLGDSLRFPIDITSFTGLGLPLSVQLSAVRRDEGPTGARYLAIYAGFCDDSEVQDPTNLRCYQPPTAALRNPAPAVRLLSEASLYVPADPARFAPERFSAAPSGRALLAVDAGVGADPHLYQFRVDDGAWSTYRAAAEGIIAVSSARLLRVGAHTIAVRSRLYGDPRTESEPASVAFWVDRERPLLHVWRDGGQVWVEVEELGSPQEVQVLSRHNQDPWRPTSSPITVQGLVGTLEVLARDAAGNPSHIARVDLNRPAEPSQVATFGEVAPDAGCAATPAPLTAALLAVHLLRRRRARQRATQR